MLLIMNESNTGLHKIIKCVLYIVILSLLSTHSGWMTVGFLIPGWDEGSKGGWTRLTCQRNHL